jgi:hypothetical protein
MIMRVTKRTEERQPVHEAILPLASSSGKGRASGSNVHQLDGCVAYDLFLWVGAQPRRSD